VPGRFPVSRRPPDGHRPGNPQPLATGTGLPSPGSGSPNPGCPHCFGSRHRMTSKACQEMWESSDNWRTCSASIRPGPLEAAGIEPASKVSRKERWRATSVARARFSAESVAPSSPLESPPVPWSPPQSWRQSGDGAKPLTTVGLLFEVAPAPKPPAGSRSAELASDSPRASSRTSRAMFFGTLLVALAFEARSFVKQALAR
jgi:hypothetical protein